MEHYNNAKQSSFYTIGLSYKKADAHLRGRFSLDEDGKTKLLQRAKKEGIEGLLLISTCNRTEMYGFAQHPFQLIKLLCYYAKGTVEEFEKVAYIYKNREAITHLFRVGTGLDSQILGDFDIVNQLKQSFICAKRVEMINLFLERLCNSVLQAGKRIKNETQLSSGITSVSFAAVQFILTHVKNVSGKNILLFGAGKIGRNTCENLVKHTKNAHITLINRTKNKAEKIAGKFKVIAKDYDDLQTEIANSDILIVATAAQHPTIFKELIHGKKQLLILDLSVPKNVAEEVGELPHVTLVHLDTLSQLTNETLERRKEDVPLAETIIEELKKEFLNWLDDRKFAPTIRALKKKLKSLKDAEIDFQRKKIADFNDEHAEIISNRIIQKITTHFANHLKENSNSSDESIDLIQKVFQLENEL